MKIDREEQERLRKMVESQQMPSTTMKSKKSGGLNAFLKKKDPNLDKLKEQYFDKDSNQADSKSAYKPADTQFSHYTQVEDFIEKQ